jgi:hypothetical protein
MELVFERESRYYLMGVPVFGVGTPAVEIAEIGVSLVSWKIVWISLVAKWRLPETPQVIGSAAAR